MQRGERVSEGVPWRGWLCVLVRERAGQLVRLGEGGGVTDERSSCHPPPAPLLTAPVPARPRRGRWGPSDQGRVPSLGRPPRLTPHLPTGTRESAFVYALSAAAISHAIARACTSGDLPGCSCGPVPGEPPGPGNRWGGCADNLSYGLLMGAKFSDAPMKVKKTGSQANKLMRLHNSEVGRQVTTPPPTPDGCACANWPEKGRPVCPSGGVAGGRALIHPH